MNYEKDAETDMILILSYIKGMLDFSSAAFVATLHRTFISTSMFFDILIRSIQLWNF